MAAALGVATLSIASEEPAAALIPLGIGALYLGGAVSGNRTVNKCREAIADYEGSYGDERYGDEDEDDPPPGRLIPRSKTARAGQPNDPYAEPRAQQYPPPTTNVQPPAYPPPQPPQQPQPYPPQPPVPQPTVQQPPPQPPPPQPQPAKRPPSPPPASDGDWSDFWREVP